MILNCTVDCKAVSKQSIKQNKSINVVDFIQRNQIKTKQLLQKSSYTVRLVFKL